MGGFIVLLLQIGFWWFLIKIIKTAANKSKKAANEQGKPGSEASARPVSKPASPPRPTTVSRDRTATSPRLKQDDYARKSAPVTPRPKPTVSTEGSSSPHVVAPSFGKKHAHTESSMPGFEECEPEPVASAVHVEETQAPETPELSFAGREIIKAMLYSEILSKPKALR